MQLIWRVGKADDDQVDGICCDARNFKDRVSHEELKNRERILVITSSVGILTTIKPAQLQSTQRRSLQITYVSQPPPSLHIHIPHFACSYCQVIAKARSLDGSLVLSGNVLERNLNVLLVEVHVRSEGAVGLPLARSTGCGLLQHLVDLLKGKTLGLRNEKVCEEEGDAAKTAPHEEYVGAELRGVGSLGDEVGGNDTDDAVPEPVGCL